MIVFALLAWARVASAHQTSVKYVGLVADGTRVAVTFRVAPNDVTEPLGLPADARPTAAEAAAKPAVAAYVAQWLAIGSRDRACEPSKPTATPDDDGKFVVVKWIATCDHTAELRLDFAAFFAVDKRHIAIIRLEGDGLEPTDAIVRIGESPLVMRAGGPPMTSLLAWVREGMHHIYSGRDHIGFVLALLLVVMLVRTTSIGWQLRSPISTLKSTATVITAFTIGHSISLIAAALGWVDLPSRLVESMIALSIAYTAIENIVHPDVRWRFFLTFGFGLVHGLGFASQLALILPPTSTVVPLLCFNVGVEVGQLTIVGVALPLFYVLARRLGADRYRRAGMPVVSALICAAGLVWFIERALEVTLLGM
ncbi:MAG: hypothetical protein JWO36_2278 [Myxococcales bacterium]|nr:hypothetical protein [Myxococcales bacterium]